MLRRAQKEPKPVLHAGELVSCGCALILLALTFGLAWYGTAALPGQSSSAFDRSGSLNGWHALPVVRWVILLTFAVTLGSALLHVSQRSHGARTDTAGLVTAVAALCAGLLFYRVLIDLPSPAAVVDQKLGAVLGLLSSIGVAFGGYESLREELALRRSTVQRARGAERAPAGR